MKKILGMMLSLALVAVRLKSVAEPILQRIERTGTIRAGAWKDAKPFGYVN
ncbi:extracellular solute-binding protein, family 3 [Crocosphaera watsonii]|uniref:Extracellular solute-binding protein, family 3 n=1 Tax=Crocosphaera watsonii WH 0401 TaxID=555881 RepID=T2JF29_CROWT|nr:extracellular solute-binding protein, family 3 [Crocosphaera watsonii]CCQ64448.1 extracellular solute-binding protein, family 3 [Crocosphaera watsonii WH 0401]